MKQVLHVEVGNYDVNITDESLNSLMEDLNSFTSKQKRLFVVSKKVFKLYNKTLNLNPSEVLIINDGEKEKNFKNYTKILQTALKMGLTRSDVIISLGGGVIGDLAGFAASTYMRGIDYIQIPTTLLSMVDSSVGGKTAIDMDNTKNIIGTFYQPKRVYININFLKTLDKKQFMSGLGEILKYSFIEDNCGHNNSFYMFEYLTLCCDKLLEKESMTLIRVIDYCLNLKIAVVNQDEKENGLRKVLNFGHTLAHALEVKGNYKKYTHGEAVVKGIYFIIEYAYKNNYISYSYYRLSLELLTKYGFVWKKIPYQPEELVEIMKRDKKATKGNITFIIPTEKKKVKEIELSPEEVIKMFL